MTRRHFFGRAGLGAVALASLLADGRARRTRPSRRESAGGGLPGLPHFAPKAKRVIYLFQSGAPSQLDLFDYKPKLARLSRHGAARLDPRWASG